MKRFALLFVFLLVAFAVSAQDYYVSSAASGNGSGTDWANAFTQLPSSLVRGATYYLGAGNYGTWDLKDPESGNSPITIQKATVDIHGTSVGWVDSYGTGVAHVQDIIFETGYYTIDGVTGGGPGEWTTGFGIELSTSVTAQGLAVVNGTNNNNPPLPGNITLEHIDFNGNGVAGGNGAFVAYNGAPGAGTHNFTVSHCYFHNFPLGADPISLFWADTANFEYNEFDDVLSDPTHHAEAFYLDACNNVTIKYNRFRNINGTSVIFVWGGSSGQAVNQNLYVYGNIIYDSPTAYTGMGFVAQKDGSVGLTNFLMYNNTIVNTNSSATWGVYIYTGSGIKIYNNLWVNSGVNLQLPTGGSGNVKDYNTAYNSTIGSAGLTGPHSKIYASGDPFENAALDNFALTGSTAPGLALPAPFNDKDMLGNTKDAANGQWDRGALQYTNAAPTNAPPPTGSGSTPPASSALPPPTGLRVVSP